MLPVSKCYSVIWNYSVSGGRRTPLLVLSVEGRSGSIHQITSQRRTGGKRFLRLLTVLLRKWTVLRVWDWDHLVDLSVVHHLSWSILWHPLWVWSVKMSIYKSEVLLFCCIEMFNRIRTGSEDLSSWMKEERTICNLHNANNFLLFTERCKKIEKSCYLIHLLIEYASRGHHQHKSWATDIQNEEKEE